MRSGRMSVSDRAVLGGDRAAKTGLRNTHPVFFGPVCSNNTATLFFIFGSSSIYYTVLDRSPCHVSFNQLRKHFYRNTDSFFTWLGLLKRCFLMHINTLQEEADRTGKLDEKPLDPHWGLIRTEASEKSECNMMPLSMLFRHEAVPIFKRLSHDLSFYSWCCLEQVQRTSLLLGPLWNCSLPWIICCAIIYGQLFKNIMRAPFAISPVANNWSISRSLNRLKYYIHAGIIKEASLSKTTTTNKAFWLPNTQRTPKGQQLLVLFFQQGRSCSCASFCLVRIRTVALSTGSAPFFRFWLLIFGTLGSLFFITATSLISTNSNETTRPPQKCKFQREELNYVIS